MLDPVTKLGLSTATVKHKDLRGKRYLAKYSKPDQSITMPNYRHLRENLSYPGTYDDLLAHESKHAGFDAIARRLNLSPRGFRKDPQQPSTEVWDKYPDIREIVGLLSSFKENPHADTFWNNPRKPRQPHAEGLIYYDPRKEEWDHDMIYDTNKINRRHSPNTERRKKDYQDILNLVKNWDW